MKIKMTAPLSYICDRERKKLKGIPGCASELEVAEKLSNLAPGTYYIVRPPVKIVIKEK